MKYYTRYKEVSFLGLIVLLTVATLSYACGGMGAPAPSGGTSSASPGAESGK